jgi:hypothetical protein
MAPVRRLVVDVLKPNDPPLVEFAAGLADTDGVERVDCSLVELDREVQNVAVTLAGPDVRLATVEERIEALGATVHSVDRVVCGALGPEEPSASGGG